MRSTLFFFSILLLCLTSMTLLLIGFFVFYRPADMIQIIQDLNPTPTPSPFPLKGVAVIGDSQSDEYRADDNRGLTYASTTLNWVELLAKYRMINFGKWQYWEEPRRQGFEYNWARSNSTTQSMIESGQHIGVAELVKQGKVNLVVIIIGANDFAPDRDDGYMEMYNGTLTDAQITNKSNRLVADIKTAIQTIQESGEVRILLLTIPDWGKRDAVQAAFPLFTKRLRVTRAIQRTNASLEKLALEEGIAVADPNVFLSDLLAKKYGMELSIGHIALNTLLPNGNPRYLFLEDGIHTGTIYNALFANFIVLELNKKVGTTLKPFSENEILNAAGL